MPPDGTPDTSSAVILDLKHFTTEEISIELASYGCPKAYTAVAKRHMSRATDLGGGFLLFGSFVARARGLHEGVLREIRASNPHAAIPLLRAWTEVVTMAMYTLKKPRYVETLLHGSGPNRPARKSFEAMFHALKDEAAQLRTVYGQLSDYSHFGPLGVWNAHSLSEDQTVTWTDAPRWRDERQLKIVCGLARELAIAGQHYLDEVGILLIPPSPGNGTD